MERVFNNKNPLFYFQFYFNNETFSPLFLWRKEKRQKKHPPSPILPRYGEAQLKIADTANFQTFSGKIGHQSPILLFFGLRKVVGA